MTETDNVNERPTVYTIGHSNVPVMRVVHLLRENGIGRLVDVRSIPASRFTPQFNREDFTHVLAAAGIEYRFAGKLLGGRPLDPQLYKNGILPEGKADYLSLVNYAKVAEQEPYRRALAHLVALASERPTAIMCSEENPLECHRHHLIAYTLHKENIPVYHLRHNGTREMAAFAVPIAQQTGFSFDDLM